MRGIFLRENREVPSSPGVGGTTPGRIGKAGGHTPMMHDGGNSDRPNVPTKLPNKAGRAAAEAAEGRGLAKGNTSQQNASRTQCRTSALSALERVREAARRDRKAKFTALLHHVTIDRLSNRFADSAITNAPKTRYVSAVASAGSSSTDVLWAYYSLPGRVKFNECIRLMKWWREYRQTTAQSLTDLPSFTLELITAKAYDERSVKETYAETLVGWFALLADLVGRRGPVIFSDFVPKPARVEEAKWTVLDPVNSTNNVVSKLAGHQIDELGGWLAAGRDAWGRAIGGDLRGDDAASLTALVELFGTPFKRHCGDK